MKKYAIRKKLKTITLTAALAAALLLGGCGSDAADGAGDAGDKNGSAGSITSDPSYTDRELDPSYDREAAEIISLKNGDVTIDREGTYILSGALSDGQVIVETPDDEKVQLVLEGVDISCSDSAPILIRESDKVFITLAEGSSNTLTGPSSFAADASGDNVDGVIFSKGDLCINGIGALTITAPSGHGIVSKDDLVITGGRLDITAADDGMQGKDCVKIWDGAFSINVGDDGIHTDADLLVSGGGFEIEQCYEGLEGNTITVNGGDIHITASDDGLNAAGGVDGSSTEERQLQVPPSMGGEPGHDPSEAGGGPGNAPPSMGGRPEEDPFAVDESAFIEINGGKLDISASGDGIDSNGSLDITGGSVIISCPVMGDTSVLDFASEGAITGGTFIGTGAVQMAQTFTSSGQGVVAVSAGEQAAGASVELTDDGGNVLISYEAPQSFAVVILSSPDIVSGEVYTLKVGSVSGEVTAD